MLQTPRTEESIFAEALGKPSLSERAAFLDDVCGTDAALRARVENLLSSHENAGSFLNKQPVTPGDTTDVGPLAEVAGTVIGRYKLLQSIGEGGFGVVYMAEQKEPVRRKVALKIIKLGMDSKEVIARFEAERQALALMDHPNIARVFDAGTTETGRPYFVMELVKGVSIAEFCDKNQLPARQRLEIFTAVCQAVQHAHQKGIIHRDIKPSNVLVTLHDGKPVPKVIDFGVAKALNQELTEKTLFTTFGHMIGTPQYMSPEQAEMSGLDVDTRTDVYSLGVLLYELLTGTTPLEAKKLRSAGYAEMQRIIREEESPLPSVRVSTLGERLSVVAKDRHCDPKQLSQLLRGELDWIVMKTLEKDRTRRYETASSLARDVERYLNNEAVEACPPSAVYRMRKFASKYRTPMQVAVAFLLLLVAGVLASTWQAVRATRAEQVARIHAKEAQVSAAVAEDQKREADGAKDRAEKRSDELAALNASLRRANYVADMNLAWRAWDENYIIRTRDLLEKHRPRPGVTDLTGFEWHYLRRQLHLDRLTVKAYDGRALMVGYSPDGHRLISFGRTDPPGERTSWFEDKAGELKQWDATTGKQLPHQLKGPTDKVTCAALSPSGKQLAVGFLDKAVGLWELETGDLITLGEHTGGSVSLVGFSPDSGYLVSFVRQIPKTESNTGPSEIKVWDIKARKAVLSLNDIPYVGSAAVSPNGKLLATRDFSDLGDVKLREVATNRELPLLKGGDGSSLSIAFTPDGKCLVGCDADGMKTWNLATGKIDQTYKDVATLLGLSPDGRRLASSTHGGVIELWDSATGERLATMRGHSGYVISLAFSPDGKNVASAGVDGTLKVWNTTGERSAVTITVPGTSTRQDTGRLWLSEDAQTFLSGFGTTTIRLWNSATGEPSGAPFESKARVTCYSSAIDGKIALGDADGRVTIWDVAAGKAVRTFQGPTKDMSDVALSRGGQWLAIAGYGKAQVWDIQKGLAVCTIDDTPKDSIYLQLSPDGKQLAAVTFLGEAKSWSVPEGRVLWTTRFSDFRFSSARFSPDGKRPAVAGVPLRFLNGDVRILDAASGHEDVTPLTGHSHIVFHVAFSPDGTRLATGSFDNTVKIWDVTSGQEVLTLKGHTATVVSVGFSLDGRRVISADGVGTVRTWNATPLPD
jgi:WD40 repeat protein